MNYTETTEWLFAQLPMYQTQGAVAYKPNLNNARALAAHLGNPQHKIKTIHVAGTNGKGSTSSMLASVLQEAGYTVGLYTSPHLTDFRERIKINGQEIPEDDVVQFIAKNKSFFEAHELSFFEMTVGLAFTYFSEQKIDIAIIEVGMGGRLDATNIISPLLSVITSIGLDHTQFLGNTLEAIAFEKAGIIKEKTPVIIGSYTQETKRVFDVMAQKNQAPIYYATNEIDTHYPSDLKGNYQENNQKVVVQTLAVLSKVSPFVVTEEQLKKGLLQVSQNTGLRGRWHQLNEAPKVVCDTAHNKDGLQVVLQQIAQETGDALHFVLGFVNDKNLAEILPLFPRNAKYYFAKPNNPRGLEAAILLEKAKAFGLKGIVFDSITTAYQQALQTAKKKDFIFVGGSTFVVAEIL